MSNYTVDTQEVMRKLQKYDVSKPHPKSLLGLALAQGDHETVTCILNGLRRDHEDEMFMTKWAKRGFCETGRNDES